MRGLAGRLGRNPETHAEMPQRTPRGDALERRRRGAQVDVGFLQCFRVRRRKIIGADLGNAADVGFVEEPFLVFTRDAVNR